jgi:hypothetical protein
MTCIDYANNLTKKDIKILYYVIFALLYGYAKLWVSITHCT